MADEFIAGVDLGGTKILSLVLDRQLTVVSRDERPAFAGEGPAAVISRVVASVRAAVAGRDLALVGISTAGPCDLARGVVTASPNLPGWHDVPLGRLVSQALGGPASIENDANCAAVAEHRLGAAKGAEHAVVVALGTGIGGG